MNLRFRAAAEVGTALFLVGLDIGPVEVLVHHIPIGAENSALVCGQCGKLFRGNRARQGSTLRRILIIKELNSRAIDCVWNGMTLSEDVLAAMGTSTPYCNNYQTLVYPADKAADFEGLTSLEGLNIAVESGSAGEDAAEALGATTVPVQAQANALMEVSAGTSDAAVIDVLMAAEMTGEGTSYADLAYSLNLNDTQGLPSEEYGVGFRQGSDLVDAFNSFWAEKVADGTVLETATTYGLQDAVILE